MCVCVYIYVLSHIPIFLSIQAEFLTQSVLINYHQYFTIYHTDGEKLVLHICFWLFVFL